MKTLESFLFLKERVNYGEKEESRPEAITAFANSAFWMNEKEQKEAIRILCGILQDPDYGIHRNIFRAVKGLEKLNAISSIREMEIAMRRIPPEDQNLITQSIERMKKGKKVENGKEMEDLKKRIVSLEEKIEQMEGNGRGEA